MKMKRKILLWGLVLCTLFCTIPTTGTLQNVYASATLSKEAKAAYLKKIKELKKEFVRENSESLMDKESAYDAFDETFYYVFDDIDYDGKKEMLVNSAGDYWCYHQYYYIYKYTNGKVEKKFSQTVSNQDIALSSDYIYIYCYDIDTIYKYDRKTYAEISYTELSNEKTFVKGAEKIDFSSSAKAYVCVFKGKTYSVYKGDTLTIGNGKTTATWYSSNKKIATVNKKGKVTAKKTGNVYLYKKTKNKLICYRVKVKNK
jgi:hypothetical protein